LTFTYDFLGRQTTASTSGGGTGQPNITLTSAYDKVGDRTSVTDNFTSVGQTTYTYDNLGAAKGVRAAKGSQRGHS